MNTQSQPLSRKNHLRLLAVATALAPALILTVSATAQATTTPDFVSIPSSTDDIPLPSCPAETLCTFQNYNYGGTRWDYAYSSHPHNQWFYVGSHVNDQITSFYNNREYASSFAENCPADNNAYWIAGGGHISNLNNGHYHWPDGNNMNDSISAIALNTSNNPSYPAHGNC
ncbi:MAG TPA: peptidase inhibitor family I36 protein [Streptosporangiaceae bacterium]